ncbi:hypothetical protein SAMN04487897_101815 [Paenibacillus sp. yr247]|nr:hypothetical protein SAMN04487897_101815 [Paenibacillus sp. yr247]
MENFYIQDLFLAESKKELTSLNNIFTLRAGALGLPVIIQVSEGDWSL